MKPIHRASPRILRLRPINIVNNEETTTLDLSGLNDEFPFKWRIQSYSQYYKTAKAIPYCDSRQVQDVFDRVCGKENWQTKYESIGGTLFCHIGILINGIWVWKSDCGTESNVEKKKGEASDALKRAAVQWGVGRFLYEMDLYELKTSKKKEQGDKASQLHCVDEKGIRIYDNELTKYIHNQRGTTFAVLAINKDVKSKDSYLEKLEAWCAKYPDERVVKALNWFSSSKPEGESFDTNKYKVEGLISVNQGNMTPFCHLVKTSRFDDDMIDMCLEGRDYKSLGDGGIAELIKAGETEQLLNDCIKVFEQESEHA